MADSGAAEGQVVVLADEAAVAHEAARRLVAELGTAIADRGEAHLALTGGSSAVALYRELVKPEWQTAVDWTRVHLWWGDERFVPIDHPESNIGLAYNLLLALSERAGESGAGGAGVDVDGGDVPALPIRIENVHPFEIDETLSESEPAELAAERYADALERYLPAIGDLPGFDVMLLGVGPDGHILSIFPGSRVLPSKALVVTVPAPEHVEPHLPRVSLNPRLLEAAGLVLVMATGDSKAEMLRHVLGGPRNPARWPAQLALLPQAVWLLDQAAGKEVGA